MKLKICMVTTSPLDFDTRILNEADTLSKNYHLTILTKKYDLPVVLKKTHFKVKRIGYFKFWPHLFNIASSILSLTIAAFKENPDIYHAHDLDGLLCAYLPAILKKKTLIYDSHEFWSDLWSVKKMRVQWLVRILEKILMARVARGITVNESLAKLLEQKYGKDFVSVSNFPKMQAFHQVKLDLREEFPGQTIVMHIGSVISGRGVEALIEANQYLPNNFITVFLGNFTHSNKLVDLVDQKKLGNKIYFKPSVPHEEILSVARQADIGVVLTQNLSVSYYYSLPNKLFQYIASGLPVLASDLPEQGQIVLGNKIGEIVDPSKPRQIARKIIKMAGAENQTKYRANLKDLAKNKYNWALESKKLLKFYKEITD